MIEIIEPPRHVDLLGQMRDGSKCIDEIGDLVSVGGPRLDRRPGLRRLLEHRVLGVSIGLGLQRGVCHLEPVTRLPAPELATPVPQDQAVATTAEAFVDEPIGHPHRLRRGREHGGSIRLADWIGLRLGLGL